MTNVVNFAEKIARANEARQAGKQMRLPKCKKCGGRVMLFKEQYMDEKKCINCGFTEYANDHIPKPELAPEGKHYTERTRIKRSGGVRR